MGAKPELDGIVYPGPDMTHAIHGVRHVCFRDDRTGEQSSWRMDDKPTVGGRDAAFELQGCIYCVSAFRRAAATRGALIPGRDTTHAIHGVRPAGGVPPSKSAILPICRTHEGSHPLP